MFNSCRNQTARGLVFLSAEPASYTLSPSAVAPGLMLIVNDLNQIMLANTLLVQDRCAGERVGCAVADPFRERFSPVDVLLQDIAILCRAGMVAARRCELD